jgi:lipopolysaccharide export system protein LptA
VSKYVIIFLLLLITGTAIAQKASKVNLISSTKSQGVKINGMDVIKVYNGVWNQDRTRMKSDSAYFYQSANAFDAFGHVEINQGDTLNIYSDKLNYNGNTKVAILTDNVKMVDKEATLTTNFFNYNTATKIGTYTNGGKLVSKTNTLISQNGYYFAHTHDAYFKNDVVGTTNDALIYTDTMRYNSQSRINYFYGPTRIYGTKDKDTLLTDNGTYNTITEQALFNKNNLYKQGTKSLKGDTLFYDRLKGYGRSVKHVVFNDNEQKITIFGGLGTYFKANDLAIVTRDPYVVLVTENSDSTSKKDTAKVIPPPSVVGKKGKKQLIDNKTKTDITKLAMQNLPAIDSASKKLTMPVIDSFSKKMPKRMSIDSVTKLASAQSKKISKADQDKIKQGIKDLQKSKLDPNEIVSSKPHVIPADTSKLKKDSVYMSADTIETRILTYKELNVLQEQERLSHIKDTTKKPSIVYKVSPKFLSITAPKWARDTSYLHRDYFGAPAPKKIAQAKPKKDLLSPKSKKIVKIDSTFLDRKIVLQDTARIRILYAFHKAKIFKSDLQAKADSMFYSNSDSTIRCYTKPMIWTQGSQLSGDTINLIMKNRRLDKMDMYPSAFIVNVEKYDSTHFNQVGGKKMRGFFKDNKLHKVYFEGNVECIYFVRDSATRLVTDMQRSSSSRMRLYLKNNEVTDLAFLTKPEHRYIPIEKTKEDEKILGGFIWKPKDRPISKESVLPSYGRAHDTSLNKHVIMPRPKKMFGKDGKPLPDVKAGADSLLKKLAGGITAKQDSTLKQQLLKVLPPGTKPAIAKKDSTNSKNLPLIVSPAVKAKRDTTN